jgi:D-amino-acid oxidase
MGRAGAFSSSFILFSILPVVLTISHTNFHLQLGQAIIQRCCALCPELGSVEEVEKRVISRNVGLRPSRKGGVRIEVEKRREDWREVPVVHCYGHAGAGYQSSW